MKIFPAIALFLLSGCTHHYYAPNAHNVPLFQQAKEARISGSAGAGLVFAGAEFQAAYSITDNIGIMANGFYAVSTVAENENESGHGKFGEFGAGYFKPLDKRFVFETYGGMGWGAFNSTFENGADASAHFRRYFVQPSIGLTIKFFDIAYSTRFCMLDFHRVNYSAESMPDNLEDLENIRNNRLSFLVEPGIILRGGHQNFKIQGRIGFSRNMNNPFLAQDYLNLNIGFCIILPDKLKEAEPKDF